ncbi:PREDICTED: uncharacterized protein LOC108498737 [Lepidothrix coronata]|uniref:Uncharacterized protein LOC108498737 n=1 Tax=Lepidothrix coronata TaxID=321398 RepID=A0A6J0HFP3_9PASS|nr:PREDICTED: uncharacterized protein LOC108498737 [Lepidothrix coronata]
MTRWRRDTALPGGGACWAAASASPFCPGRRRRARSGPERGPGPRPHERYRPGGAGASGRTGNDNTRRARPHHCACAASGAGNSWGARRRLTGRRGGRGGDARSRPRRGGAAARAHRRGRAWRAATCGTARGGAPPGDRDEITEWEGFGTDQKDRPVPASLSLEQLVQRPIQPALNTARVEESTISLGNLFQCLTTLTTCSSSSMSFLYWGPQSSVQHSRLNSTHLPLQDIPGWMPDAH